MISRYFVLAYLLLFLTKVILFDFAYSWSKSAGGWNGDAFFWNFSGYMLSKLGFNWERFSSLFSSYFPESLMQMPFVGLLSPAYTLLTALAYKLGMNAEVLRILSILCYMLSFILMERILLAFGISKVGRLLVILMVFFNPYTLFLSFKLRPDNFAFFLSILSLYLATKGRALSSSLAFSIGVFGFKIQTLGWVVFHVFFLAKRSSRKLILFLSVFLISALLYNMYYRYILDHLPLLSKKLRWSNTLFLKDAFDTIHVFNIAQLVGFIGLGIFALSIVGFWLAVFIATTGKKLLPHMFPPRSHSSNFVFEMGLGFMYETFRKVGYKPARIVGITFLILLVGFQMKNMLWAFVHDWRETSREERFYRKIVELSTHEKVCSFMYVSTQYLRMFVENENLELVPLSSPELEEMDTRGCRYVAVFVSHGVKEVQWFSTKMKLGDYYILSHRGDVVFHESSGIYFEDPKFYRNLSGLGVLLAWFFYIMLSWNTLRRIV